MNADLYATLGVARDAKAGDIKDAYRRRVKATHPDRGGDEEKFRAIQKAWEILRDERKRERYDKYGETEPNESLRRLQNLASKIVSPDHDDFLAEPLRELRSLHDELHKTGQALALKLEKIAQDLKAIKEADKEEECHYVVSALLALRKGLNQMKDSNDDDLKLCLEVLTQYQVALDLVGRTPKPKPQPQGSWISLGGSITGGGSSVAGF